MILFASPWLNPYESSFLEDRLLGSHISSCRERHQLVYPTVAKALLFWVIRTLNPDTLISHQFIFSFSFEFFVYPVL